MLLWRLCPLRMNLDWIFVILISELIWVDDCYDFWNWLLISHIRYIYVIMQWIGFVCWISFGLSFFFGSWLSDWISISLSHVRLHCDLWVTNSSVGNNLSVALYQLHTPDPSRTCNLVTRSSICIRFEFVDNIALPSIYFEGRYHTIELFD